MQTFVKDVGRFQRGEPLSVPSRAEDADMKPAAVERTYATKPKPAKKEEANAIFGDKLIISTKDAVKTKRAAVAKAPAAAAAEASTQQFVPSATASKQQALPPPDAAAFKPTQEENKPSEEKQPPKSHPPKGKPSIVCGCFGSLHKPLTNCLYCGRISCEREGYDFCPFCGMLVEQVKGKGDGYVIHMDYCRCKNSLLTYDLVSRAAPRPGNTRNAY